MYRIFLTLATLFTLSLEVSSGAIGLVNYTVAQYNNPSPGYLYLAPASDEYIELVDNGGYPGPNYQTALMAGNCYDLNIQNGKITFYYTNLFTGTICYLGLDQNYQVTDTFACKNFETDFHDFRLMPNGHTFYIGLDRRTIDMSRYINGGVPNARVQGFVIQEQDQNKNIVFQWNSFDHLNITDATEDIDLRQSNINPWHCNSIEIDNDGNIIISIRHLDEVIKINHSTGNIMWRMGGTKSKNNQFTFINDSRDNFTGFSHQHCVRRLPNGNLAMFDNGNLKPTRYSRAVEYAIDENSKTATKVWDYSQTPLSYSESMGSIQKLPNGNTLIGWGQSNNDVVATELASDGLSVAFQISNPMVKSYKAYRYTYKAVYVNRSVNSSASYSFNDGSSNTNVELNLSSFLGSGNIIVEKHKYLAHNISFSGSNPGDVYPVRWVIHSTGIQDEDGKIRIDLSSFTDIRNPDQMTIYFRPQEATGQFVNITSNYNYSSSVLESNYNGPGEYIICVKEADPPVMIYPSNNSRDVTTNLKFIWKNYGPNSNYRIQISQDITFNTLNIDSSSISDTVFTCNLRNYTKYYWRVKATNNFVPSSWSEAWNFTTFLPAPRLIYPSDSLYSQNIDGTFLWSTVDNATSYRLQVSDDSDFTNKNIIDQTTGSNSFDFKNLAFNQRYYWRVAAVNQSKTGLWSDVFSFATVFDTVELLSPLNPSYELSLPVFLKWHKQSDSIFYNLQVSENYQFSNIIVSETGLTDTFYLAKTLENSKTYFWRIQSFNSLNKSLWSNPFSFSTKVGYPLPELPLNHSRNAKLTSAFQWAPVKDNTGYHLQIAKDSLFSSFVVDKDFLVSETYSNAPLDYDSHYFWRVSVRTKTSQSDWSPVYEFTTRQEFYIDAPNGIVPSKNEYNLNKLIVLKWQIVPDADSYNFELSVDSLFSSVLLKVDNISADSVVYDKCEFNKTYFWHIRSHNSKSISDWSEVYVFHTKLAPPALIQPADKKISVKQYEPFVWSNIEGASAYNVQISKNSDFSDSVEVSVNENHTGLMQILTNNSTYYWRSKAINGPKESDWSDTWSFNTEIIFDVTDDLRFCNFIISPNPASQFINIPIGQSKPYVIHIYDLNGVLIKTLENNLNISSDKIAIDTKYLINGHYFITYYDGKNYYSGKFEIQH